MLIDLSTLNNVPAEDIIEFIQDSMNLVMSISALTAVAMLVKAGIGYIISAGDETKAEKAQKEIIYSLVGLVIVFIAPLIIKFVIESLLIN